MDEWQALDTFWNSFGLPAYDENTVPDNVVFPYITYEGTVGKFDESLILSAALWYRSTSWAEISRKALDIGTEIGGGMGVEYDNGRLWVVKGDQFMQRRGDPENNQIRRIEIQIQAEFQTSE